MHLKLKSTCELQVFVHDNSTFLVITRIKPRYLRYFNGHDRQITHHWLCPDHWAEYESGLQKIFDEYDGKDFINEEFRINTLIHVQIKSSSILKESVCHLLNLEDKDNVTLVLECNVEYSDEAEKTTSDQEYRLNATSRETHNIPAKKQKRSSPKVAEDEPYEVIESSAEKIYTPLPIKRKKSKSINAYMIKAPAKDQKHLAIAKDKTKRGEQITIKSKKIDDKQEQSDMLAKYVTVDVEEIKTPLKRQLKCSPNSECDLQLRRSARSPVKPKYFIDSIENPLAVFKRSTHKRNTNSDKKEDNNNIQNAFKQKIAWCGKMSASKGKEDLNRGNIKNHLVKKIVTYSDEENKDYESSKEEGKQNEQDSNDNYTNYTNEELEAQQAKFTKQLKENEEIRVFLDKNLEPPPRAVDFLPLDHLSKEEILNSFSEHRIKLDETLKELRKKSKILHKYGINHYTIMGLISDEIQNDMMIMLGDEYNSKFSCLSRVHIYTNALLPEWIVRIFMKNYNIGYREAIDQIIAQKKYRQYKESESNDLSDFT